MRRFLSGILKGQKKNNYPPLEVNTKHILLSATGCLGGDLCDLILKYTEQDEQKFVVSIETGLFAIAITSYFFTLHYRKDIPPLSIALELSEMYENHFSELNGEGRNKNDNPIGKYFLSEAKTTLSTTVGAMLSEEVHSEKFYWTLSRVLYQRICLSCANNFGSLFQLDTNQIDEIEAGLKNGINAYLLSLKICFNIKKMTMRLMPKKPMP